MSADRPGTLPDGAWPPAEVAAVARLLAGFECPWAVGGGWAIDLFLGRRTRPHKDVDVALLRRDHLSLQSYLHARGWSTEVARDGALVPWPAGERLDPPDHVVWCRHPGHEPDFVELLLEEADGGCYLFRRDPSLRLDLARVYLARAPGLAVVAPEVALLYKAKAPEEADAEADFRAVLPALDLERRARLRAGLGRLRADHPWLTEV